MNKKNRKIVFICLLVIGISIPFYYASAGGIGRSITNWLVSTIVKFMLRVSSYIVCLSSALLDWVLGEDFIDWSYTGLDNPLINVGWGITRDLANMFFIIALAGIGLATALRIEKYKYQKLLPKLILIALLINFTPVICGFIVDASNIVMNFFLEQYSGLNNANDFFLDQTRSIDERLEEGFNLVVMTEVVLQGGIMVWFNYWLSAIFLLFSFLFIGRYIAIWILVIMSPIAFFSYIIPASNKLWKDWWNWFLQWCFIGTTAGFFLYLGNHMLLESGEMIQRVPVVSGELSSFWVGFLHMLIPYGASLAFISFGFFQALNSSVAGSKYAVKGFNWAKGTAAPWVGKQVKSQTLDKWVSSTRGRKTLETIGAVPKVEEAFGHKAWEKLESKGKIGKVVGTAGKAVGTIGKWTTNAMTFGLRKGPIATGIGMASQAALQYSSRVSQQVDAKKKKFKEHYKGDFPHAAKDAMRTPKINYMGRIAKVKALTEMGGALGLKGLSEDFLGETIQSMGRYAPYLIPDIVKHRPDLIDPTTKTGKVIISSLVDKGTEDEHVKGLMRLGLGPQEAITRAAYQKVGILTKPQDFDTMTNETFLDKENEYFLDELVLHGSVGKIRRVYEEKSPEIQEALDRAFERVGARKIMRSNRSLARARVSSPVLSKMIGADIGGLRTIRDYDFAQEALGMNDTELQGQRLATNRDITEAGKRIAETEIEIPSAIRKISENEREITQAKAKLARAQAGNKKKDIKKAKKKIERAEGNIRQAKQERVQAEKTKEQSERDIRHYTDMLGLMDEEISVRQQAQAGPQPPTPPSAPSSTPPSSTPPTPPSTPSRPQQVKATIKAGLAEAQRQAKIKAQQAKIKAQEAGAKIKAGSAKARNQAKIKAQQAKVKAQEAGAKIKAGSAKARNQVKIKAQEIGTRVIQEGLAEAQRRAKEKIRQKFQHKQAERIKPEDPRWNKFDEQRKEIIDLEHILDSKKDHTSKEYQDGLRKLTDLLKGRDKLMREMHKDGLSEEGVF